MAHILEQEKSPKQQPAPDGPNLTRAVTEDAGKQAVTRRRLILTLSLCLIMFLLAESVARVVVALGHPIQSHAVEFDRKYQLATAKAPAGKPMVLILGDSLIDFALYPELLATRLKEHGMDVTVRNLAVPGSTMETGLFLLKASVKKGIKPALVIYDVHPRLYNRSFYQNEKNTNADFTHSLTGSCQQTQGNWVQGASCFIKKNMYLVGYRSYLKDELLKLNDTILKPANRLKFEPSLYPKTEVSPAGWAPGYEVFTDMEFQEHFSQPKQFAKIAAEFRNFEWTNAHFLALQQYCREQHIPLLMVWLPEHPITAQYHQKLHVSDVMLDRQFNRLFRQTNTGYANFHRILDRSDQFHTPDHVNPLGAIPVTDRMAAILTEQYPHVLQSAQSAHTTETSVQSVQSTHMVQATQAVTQTKQASVQSVQTKQAAAQTVESTRDQQP